MAKNQTYRRKRSSAPLGLVLIGAGLITFAIVAGIFLLDNPQAAASTPNANRSGLRSPAVLSAPAPALELQDVNGQDVSLADLRGQVVLVNNWATWCPPCKAEMPELEAYFREHQAEGFTLVAVNAGDPRSDVAQFVEEYQLSFQVWLDPYSKAIRAFQNNSLPSSYVVDRDGSLRLAWSGAINLDTLEEYVTPLIKE